MIVRGKRFNSNDRIKELGILLPKSSDLYHDICRQNKDYILRASIEYIRRLKQDPERVKELEAWQKQMEQANRRLLLQIQGLELRAKAHGLPLQEELWRSLPEEAALPASPAPPAAPETPAATGRPTAAAQS